MATESRANFLASAARPQTIVEKIEALDSSAFGKAAEALERVDRAGYQAGLQAFKDSPSKALLRSVGLDGSTEEARKAFARIASDHLRERLDRNLSETDSLRAEVGILERKQAAITDLYDWFGAPFVLERPTSSVTHQMVSAFRNNRVCFPLMDSKTETDFGIKDAMNAVHQVFLVEHDWAGAFVKATDYAEGAFRCPYEVCSFEFRISGHRVCAVVSDFEERGIECLPIVETKGGWTILRVYQLKTDTHEWHAPILGQDQMSDLNLMNLIGSQVKAISVALEAEIATTEIVRAPYRLNHAREKRGELPVFDYHTVSLTRRARGLPLDADDAREPGRHKRLHFVRGHWRHYPTHKTWIKWHLRGDPDLGFIDKHYRL